MLHANTTLRLMVLFACLQALLAEKANTTKSAQPVSSSSTAIAAGGGTTAELSRSLGKKPDADVYIKLHLSPLEPITNATCNCNGASLDDFRRAVETKLKSEPAYNQNLKVESVDPLQCNDAPAQGPGRQGCYAHIILRLKKMKDDNKQPQSPADDAVTSYIEAFNGQAANKCVFLGASPNCDSLFNGIMGLADPNKVSVTGCAVKDQASLDNSTQCADAVEPSPPVSPSPSASPSPHPYDPPPPRPETGGSFDLGWQLSSSKDSCECFNDSNPVVKHVATVMEEDLNKHFNTPDAFSVSYKPPMDCNITVCQASLNYTVSVKPDQLTAITPPSGTADGGSTTVQFHAAPPGGRRLLQDHANIGAPEPNKTLQRQIIHFDREVAQDPEKLCQYLPNACQTLRNETNFDIVNNCTDKVLCAIPASTPAGGPQVPAWAIAIIVVGGVLLIAAAVSLIVFCCCKRKRAAKHKDKLATHHPICGPKEVVLVPHGNSSATGAAQKLQQGAVGVVPVGPPRVPVGAAKLMAAPVEHAAPGNYTVGYTTLEMEQELGALETAVNTLVATLTVPQVEAMLSAPHMPPELLQICRNSYKSDRGLYEYTVGHVVLLWCSSKIWLPLPQLIDPNSSWLLIALQQCGADFYSPLSAAARAAISRWSPALAVVKAGTNEMARDLLPGLQQQQQQQHNEGEVMADMQGVVEAAMRCQLMALSLSPNMQLPVSGFGSEKGVVPLDSRMQFVRRYAGFKSSQVVAGDPAALGPMDSHGSSMKNHMTPTEVLLCCRPGVLWYPPQGSSGSITMVKEEEVVTSEQGW